MFFICYMMGPHILIQVLTHFKPSISLYIFGLVHKRKILIFEINFNHKTDEDKSKMHSHKSNFHERVVEIDLENMNDHVLDVGIEE